MQAGGQQGRGKRGGRTDGLTNGWTEIGKWVKGRKESTLFKAFG